MSDDNTLKSMGPAQYDTTPTPPSQKLFGGVNDFSTQDPSQPPQCDNGDPFAPLDGIADQIPKPKPKPKPKKRKPLTGSAQTGGSPPLKGSASQPGPGNVNLLPGTPTLEPPAPPKTGGVQKTGGSPPIQGGTTGGGGMPPYDPLHPAMGQYVPPDARTNLPPGWLVFTDGYLHPDENVRPDSNIDLIIPSLLSGGLIRLFTPRVIPTLPPVVVSPPAQEVEEQVWVSITERGQIIWRKSQTFFGKTNNGYYATEKQAIANGARHPLPGYARAGGK